MLQQARMLHVLATRGLWRSAEDGKASESLHVLHMRMRWWRVGLDSWVCILPFYSPPVLQLIVKRRAEGHETSLKK